MAWRTSRPRTSGVQHRASVAAVRARDRRQRHLQPPDQGAGRQRARQGAEAGFASRARARTTANGSSSTAAPPWRTSCSPIRQYYRLEEIWGDKPVRLRSAAPPWPRRPKKRLPNRRQPSLWPAPSPLPPKGARQGGWRQSRRAAQARRQEGRRQDWCGAQDQRPQAHGQGAGGQEGAGGGQARGQGGRQDQPARKAAPARKSAARPAR
jgi:hypothetical protein